MVCKITIISGHMQTFYVLFYKNVLQNILLRNISILLCCVSPYSFFKYLGYSRKKRPAAACIEP